MSTNFFKGKAYKKYRSTHSKYRSVISIEDFKRFTVGYNETYKEFLPAPTGCNIVDLGCGDGRLIWWLQANG